MATRKKAPAPEPTAEPTAPPKDPNVVTLGGREYRLTRHPSMALRLDCVAAAQINGFRGVAACLAVCLPAILLPRNVTYASCHHNAMTYGGACIDHWLDDPYHWKMNDILAAGKVAYNILNEGLDDLWQAVEEVEGNSEDPA